MLAESINFECAGRALICDVIRSSRRTLQLEVLPDMSVRMVVPERVPLERCRQMLIRRTSWVTRQRQYFSQFHPLTKPREYVSGETHLYLGRRYRLRVHSTGKLRVWLARPYLNVRIKEAHSKRMVEAAVWSWYREEAKDVFQQRLLKGILNLNLTGKDAEVSLCIKTMKSRWGSMSGVKKMTLNLDLIRAPIECVDYVITHELCHIKVPHHGPKFWTLLDRVMPDWQERKDKLERLTA